MYRIPRDRAELERIRTRQRGMFTTEQAEAAGYDADTLYRRIRYGELIRITHGVFGAPGIAAGHLDRAYAEILRLRFSAVAARGTAALAWGLTQETPFRIELNGRTPTRRTGVRVTPCTLGAGERVLLEDLPIVSPIRCLFENAAHWSPTGLRRAVGDVSVRGLATIDRIGRVAEAASKVGPLRAGARAVLAILDDGAVTDSALEDYCIGLLVAAGLPEPERQWPVPGTKNQRFDGAWPNLKLGLEFNGAAAHATLEAQRRDARKLRAAALAGWQVLMFVGAEVRRDPQRFVATVREALMRAVKGHAG